MRKRLGILVVIAVCLLSCQTFRPSVGSEVVAAEANAGRADAYAHYISAVTYLRMGEVKKALSEMRLASDLAPEALSVHAKLMEIYVRLQDYENALVMCERALEEAPDSLALWLRYGGILNRLEKYEDAAAAFERAIELDPAKRIGYQALVSLEESTNDLVAAIEVYERLVELHPENGRLHFQLGLGLARIRDDESAREVLERALELDPDLWEARLLLGVVYLDGGANNRAAAVLQKFLEHEPGNLRAVENLSAAFARMGRYGEAAALFDGLLPSQEADPIHYIERIYLTIRAGRFQDAAGLAVPTEAPIMGTVLHAIAREKAGGEYRKVLERLDQSDGDIDDECTQYLNELVFLFGKEDAGRFFEAILERWGEHDVASRTLRLMLARLYLALERYVEAEAVLLEVLEQYGGDKWTHYYLASVYEPMDRIEDAEKHLEAVLELDPENPEVMNFLGYLYADANMKLDKAEGLLTRALEIDPENGFYLDSLGWVYYRKGDAGRAIDLIQKAILAMENDDAVLRDHLGDAYLLNGETKKALRQWRRARRLDPELEGVGEKIERYGGAEID